MTKNQIAYWDFKEKQRYNDLVTKEQARTNKANENIKSEANKIQLALGQGNLSEQVRTNKVKEAETHRANVAGEGIKRDSNTINQQNADTNARNAEIGAFNSLVNERNAATNLMNAQTSIANLSEVSRHNQEMEDVQKRQLEETNRTNVANEDIKRFGSVTDYSVKSQQVDIGKSNLDETRRHNQVTERETKRNNLINQQLDAAKLQETIQRDKFTTMASLLNNATPSVRLSYGGK